MTRGNRVSGGKAPSGPARDAELRIDSVAIGGAGVGRASDRAVVFVEGGLPGEEALVTITEVKKDFRRGYVKEIKGNPSPWRTEPPCEFVADGCGGCGWQHVEVVGQRLLKQEMIRSAWQRAWRGEAPELPEIRVVELPEWGFRTTVRAGVSADGSLGLRAERTHDIVPVGPCAVAHPLVDSLLREVRLPGASEVTLRAGVASGERLIVVVEDRPSSTTESRRQSGSQAPLPPGWVVPGDVAVVRAHHPAEPQARRWITENVAGRDWRVSAFSFFQSRPDGAEEVVRQVREALAGTPEAGGRLVDLYSGVGVIGGSLLARGSAYALPGEWRLTAVERAGPSTHDARRNLRGIADRVVFSAVEDWRAHRADAVVADPARAGLGREGVATVAATRAPVLALVSCDVAAWARDATLLAAEQYHLESVTMIDMFPHTPHVELVSRFVRRSRREARAARRAALAEAAAAGASGASAAGGAGPAGPAGENEQ